MQSSLDIKLIGLNSQILIILKQIDQIKIAKDLTELLKNEQIQKLRGEIDKISEEIDQIKTEIISKLNTPLN